MHSLFSTTLSLDRSIYFDLSHPDGRGSDQVQAFADDIEQLLRKHRADIGIGRYNENRHCYQSEIFQKQDEARTLHIGLDLFVPPGTDVYAPMDATIHSFNDNNNLLDYGPTIILQHAVNKQVNVYSLYGHLSRASLNNLCHGKTVSAGDKLGQVGNYPENGNWPPHVHVQLMSDMLDMQGDFPGVVEPTEAPLWLELCPDPKWIVALPTQSPSNTFKLNG